MSPRMNDYLLKIWIDLLLQFIVFWVCHTNCSYISWSYSIIKIKISWLLRSGSKTEIIHSINIKGVKKNHFNLEAVTCKSMTFGWNPESRTCFLQFCSELIANKSIVSFWLKIEHTILSFQSMVSKFDFHGNLDNLCLYTFLTSHEKAQISLHIIINLNVNAFPSYKAITKNCK